MSTSDEQFAHFYDLEYRGYSQDVEFYVQYALALDQDRQLPALELGCGTGRLCVALAEAGFRVVGVDLSQAMLEVAAQHVTDAGLGEKVALVCADMRDLSHVPPGPYNLAFWAINTFAYLPTREDQLAALRAVYPLLVPHGILIIDLTPSFPEMLSPDGGEVLHQGSYYDEHSGATLHKFVAGRVDYATQMHHVTIFYDQESVDGSLSRFTHSVDFRWTGRYEMELLLDSAGYEVEELYGGYDLEDFDESSERMIFVARRKS